MGNPWQPLLNKFLWSQIGQMSPQVSCRKGCMPSIFGPIQPSIRMEHFKTALFRRLGNLHTSTMPISPKGEGGVGSLECSPGRQPPPPRWTPLTQPAQNSEGPNELLQVWGAQPHLNLNTRKDGQEGEADALTRRKNLAFKKNLAVRTAFCAQG